MVGDTVSAAVCLDSEYPSFLQTSGEQKKSETLLEAPRSKSDFFRAAPGEEAAQKINPVS